MRSAFFIFCGFLNYLIVLAAAFYLVSWLGS